MEEAGSGSLSFCFLIHCPLHIHLLLTDRGQGCRFLRDNLATDVLALGSPIPAHKYPFWKEKQREQSQIWHHAGTKTSARGSAGLWPTSPISALCNPSLRPSPRFQSAPLLPFSSLRILLPPLCPPPAAGKGEELWGHRMGLVLPTQGHLSQGHGLVHIYKAFRKKQASFLDGL